MRKVIFRIFKSYLSVVSGTANDGHCLVNYVATTKTIKVLLYLQFCFFRSIRLNFLFVSIRLSFLIVEIDI